MEEKENKKTKKQLSPYIRFTSIGLQMRLTIYLGAWLDGKFPNEDQLYYKTVSLLAVFLAIFSVIRQVIKITNKNS